MLVIPVKAVPNQQIQTQVNGQAVTLNIYQNPFGLFMDVYVGATQIIAGVICENLTRIVRDAYLGFIGDFCWMDTQAASLADATDPVYTGLGARYQLLYLFPSDLS